jgi:ABC-type hemin transport system ATPase subunit
MSEPLSEQVIKKIDEAHGLYNRLVLITGPQGSGKTKVLYQISTATSAPLININLELSQRMLDLTERQRALQLSRLLGEIMGETKGDLILLDNIEILFDVRLKQDPMRLLQGLSRNKTIVASWGGSLAGDQVTYAMPGHPEYRRYRIRDFLVVNTEAENE